MRRLPLALLAAALSTACAGDITGPGTGDGGGGDDDGVGPDPGDPPDGPIDPQDPQYEGAHPRIYLPRNRDRLVAALDTAAGARFRNIVTSQVGGSDLYDYQQWFGALLSQLSGDTSYCDYAVEHVDAFVAAEEALIAQGARPDVAFDSYLEVGGKIGDVMLTYDWCFDQTTAEQRTRWTDYAAQTVWNVWHPEEATWGGAAHPWSGWSIDNPSNNYYYSFLRATMLFGLAAHDEHPDAAGWLAFFREQKFQAQVVPTFESNLQGGGSREGTGYGVSMHLLWVLYDFWHGSTGEDLARQTTHTRASMLNMVHAIVPTLDRVAPVGDHARDSTASLFDYHRNYLGALAYLFRDDALASRVKWVTANSSVPTMGQHFMAVYDFLYAQPELAEESPDALSRYYHAPGIGQVYGRSSWDADATWFNVIAGPYTESHAHHDQGSFMVFKGGWLAYDAIVESHSGIRQEEELHNLVRVTSGGTTVRQREGTVSEVTALHRGDGWMHVAVDVTAAYDGNAAVQKVERELVFVEPDVLVVFDRVTTASGTQQIWQLNAPTSPAISGARATITGDAHALRVDRLTDATSSVYAWTSDGEFSGGYRLDSTVAGGAQQHLHVLSMDQAVTSVTRSDGSGRIGAQLALADGRTVTVRFSATAVDGTIEINGASTSLPPGLDPL
jgi:hypothetical protein